MGRVNDEPDICYRIRLLDIATKDYIDPQYTRWSRPYTSAGGSSGCFISLTAAKQSASNRIGSGYQIWKFHCGLPTSNVPYFMPELAFTKPYQE